MSNNNFKITHGLEVANGITVAAGGLNVVGGSITLPSELQIGTAADKVRFPNTSVSISNITLDTKPSELHNIGLLAEGLASNTDISTYGIGVYGVGYTANDTRSSGVVGEGHVSDTSDAGSSVGVRGYSLDAHSGGANIGLYGNAANGLTNYALYMSVGDIYSGSEQHWTLSGDLTFTGSHTVTIPSLALLNPLPVTSGGTGVTTSTGTGNVVLSTNPTLVTPVLGDATATTINKVTITAPATGSTITVLDGKTLAVNNTLTFTGTDSSSVAFGAGGAVIYATDKISALSSTTSAELAGVISDETGTGALVFANTPALTSPSITTSLTTDSTSFDLVNTNATTVNLAGGATTLNVGASTGTTTINNDLIVSGNVTFGSGTTQISATVINVDDPLIYLASNNTADILDIGIIGAYDTGTHTHAGVVRDATDKVWKIFSGVTDEATSNVVDFTNATYDDLKIGGLHATTGEFSSTVTATQLTSTIATGTAPFVVSSTTPVANLSIGGNAATVTTNANLTGVITSVGNATSIASQTGTGTKFVMDTSPTLVTPVLGSATATTINKVTISAPASSATLTLANGSSLVTSGAFSTTLTSSADTNVTLPTSGTLVNSDVTTLSSLASVGTISTGTWSGNFGSVSGANLTSLTAGNLTGTIPSAVLGNSSVFIGSTSVALNRATAALSLTGVDIDGSAGGLKTTSGSVVVSGANAPSTGHVLTAINGTSASWAPPAVADLGAASGTLPVLHGGTGVTTSTGSGNVVLSTNPTLVTPVLGDATATTINKVTITEPAVGSTITVLDGKTLAVNNTLTFSGTDSSSVAFGTGGTVVYAANKLSALSSTTSAELAGVISDETGTGALVFANTPALTSPAVATSLTTGSASFDLINTTAATVNLAGAATTLNMGASTGTTTVHNDLVVSGSITFGSGATQLSATVLNIDDTLIYMADNNTADILDIGFIGAYNPDVHTHTGLVRDATDKVWKIFSGVTAEPVGNVMDFTGATYDDLKIGGLHATTGAFSSTVSATQLTSTIATGTAPFVVTSTTPVANLSIGGNAATVTTNANLTGVITSVGNATSIASQTGTGTKFVMDTSPVLVTPTLGAATATTVNKVTITAPASSATLTLANGSSLITSGAFSTTLTATADTNVTLPTSGTLVNTAVTTLNSLASVGTITTGTWSGSFGAVTGANLTNLTAGNLTGTIPSTVLGNSSVFIGSTSVALNRATGNLSLTGVSIDGNAATVTTNANLTGVITSDGNATSIASQTGTGTKFVMDTSPTLVTPVLGDATATTINKVTITAPATGSTITVLDGKTLAVNNTLTFTGTDSSSVAFGTGGTVVYAANKISALSATTSAELAGVISDETGTGALVFANTPTLVTPVVTTSLTTDSTSFDLVNTTATTVNLAGAATSVNIGASTGNTTIKNNLVVTGNITFGSGTTQLSATVIQVDDTLVYLAKNNTADILDIGFVGAYDTGKHTGLVRDHANKDWKLFSNVATEPGAGNTIDFTGATYDALTMGGLHATTGEFSSTVTATQLTSTIATGTAPFVVTSTTPVANLSIGGNAATVTTNANLTGVITSVGNATSIASQTGTGTKFVMDTSPTLTGTPLAPTATAGTNTTQIATTEFVSSAVSTAVTTIDGGTY